MNMEVVTLVEDWLKSDINGVNAMLLAVPILDGHTRPKPIGFIASQYSDERVVKWTEPPKLNALYVTEDGPTPMDPLVMPGQIVDSDVGVAVRYVVSNADLHLSMIDANYVMRAVVQSMRRFSRNEGGNERNSVSAWNIKSMRYGPWKEAVGNAMAVSAFAATIAARDVVPLG